MRLSSGSENTSPMQRIISAGGYAFGHVRVLMLVAAAAIAVGLALNWTWLVAAGIAPILLSTLPCVLMCALGVCMMCRAKPGSASPGLSLEQTRCCREPASAAADQTAETAKPASPAAAQTRV